MSASQTKRPVIFGEVLFDEFEGDKRVLGGAPFNVAWHLQGFGLLPLMISRIGMDKAGAEVEQAMAQWHMDRAGIQKDADRQTGRVSITMSGGQHTFDIVSDVAYDYIERETALAQMTAHAPGLFYHGSLAARKPESLSTLEQIKKKCRAPVYVDINLRDPWWSVSTVEQLLQGASWLKLNNDELRLLVPNTRDEEAELTAAATTLLKRHSLELIIVTRGEEGAFIQTQSECITTPPVRAEKLVDTVGAGDAFCAVTIMGLLLEWDYATMLQRASYFAARICEQRGAINRDPAFYEKLCTDWSL